ncbi:MAG TPA: M23 family metallopeptidase, partial [Xenococcaceae cyanobacterium]
GNTANPAIIATELTNESESKRSTTTYSLNAEEREQTTPRKEAESVSVAPSTAQGYDEIMELAALNRSIPDLPPLSSPEEYLPNGYFKGYIWPAQGTFTSGFGMRWGRMHKGIDIAAPIGTPIMAAASGEVIVAGWNSGGFGNLVKLKHSDGSVTLYAHNNRIYVRQGQTVEQGQQIAEMGSTGFSTGPHLHFEIRPNGNTAVNPIAHLPSK